MMAPSVCISFMVSMSLVAINVGTPSPVPLMNSLTFIGATNLTYIETDHKITEGQPWANISVHDNSLVIWAGRHKTKEVAAYFNDDLDYAKMVSTVSGPDDMPGHLNFATKGLLSLTTQGQWHVCPVRIAQGHIELTSN